MWHSILLAIASILTCALALAKAGDALLRDSEKKRILELLETGWFRTAELKPIEFIRRPLRNLRELFDHVLGSPDTFSLRSFCRISVISAALLVTALAVSDIFSNTPMGGVLPWDFYDVNIAVAKQQAAQATTNRAANTPGSDYVRESASEFLAYDSALTKSMYCTLFIVVALLLNSISNFFAVIILRQLLRELEQASGFMTFMAAFVFDLFAALTIAIVSTTALVVLTMPAMWKQCFMLLVAVTQVESALMAITAGGIVATLLFMLTMWLGGTAIKIGIVIMILPTLLCGLALGWAAFAHPWKRVIHTALTSLLLRAAESGKGLFLFVAAVLAMASVAVVWLAHVL